MHRRLSSTLKERCHHASWAERQLGMATRFTFPEGARLRILTVSGNVTVTGEDRPDGEIEPGREPHISDDQHAVEFKSRSNNLHIRVPAGMNVSVGTVSGNVT